MWCPYAFKHSTENYVSCNERGIPCPLSDCNDETEVRKCGERTTLCGFLAPDGTFFHCKAYGHMAEAERLVWTEMGLHIKRGLDAERFLLMKSYVAFYARRVGFLATGSFPLGRDEGEKNKVRLLTTEQIAFLEDALTFCNIDEKRDCIKEILQEDYLLKNDKWYRREMERPVS